MVKNNSYKKSLSSMVTHKSIINQVKENTNKQTAVNMYVVCYAIIIQIDMYLVRKFTNYFGHYSVSFLKSFIFGNIMKQLHNSIRNCFGTSFQLPFCSEILAR